VRFELLTRWTGVSCPFGFAVVQHGVQGVSVAELSRPAMMPAMARLAAMTVAMIQRVGVLLVLIFRQCGSDLPCRCPQLSGSERLGGIRRMVGKPAEPGSTYRGTP
jgi:hypothetical protein